MNAESPPPSDWKDRTWRPFVEGHPEREEEFLTSFYLFHLYTDI